MFFLSLPLLFRHFQVWFLLSQSHLLAHQARQLALQDLALDQDLVPEAVQDQDPVADLVLAAVQEQESHNRVQLTQDQALVALELLQVRYQPTHIPTSFIPEMVQSNTAASSIATAALTPTITPMATTTTVIPQTITSTISMVQMDKAEENNPPLSPSLRKVSISKRYKQ